MRFVPCTAMPSKVREATVLLAVLTMGGLPRTAVGAELATLARKCSAGDQKACASLVKMAKTERNPAVRFSAVQYLTDQAALAEIARTDADWQIRRLAVSGLKDEAALYQVAKSDSNAHLRWFAVRKMADQKLLAEIARTNSDEALRKAALENLLDQSVLAEIARSDVSEKVRKAAGELLGPSRTYQTVVLTLAAVERAPRWTIPALGEPTEELRVLVLSEHGVQFSYSCETPCRKEGAPPRSFGIGAVAPGIPGAAESPVFTAAPEGWEMVVVRLKVRAAPGHKEPVPGACLGVTDAAGKTYQQPQVALTFIPGLDYECGFAVPKGTELKTLHMSDLTFDLSEPAAKGRI